MSILNQYSFKPEIILPENESGLSRLHSLLHEVSNENIHDLYSSVLEEIVQLDNPRKQYTQDELKSEVDSRLEGIGLYQGCWVYYPWNKKLVHLPEEHDFIKVRTSRNLYKITSEERDLLASKKVGIIGLSVGHAVAMNLALERSVGELRLADFDSMELSNLNRIRSNIFNIKLPKIIVAAREIAEIDPFIEVKIFPDGINEDNIEDFIGGEDKLDALVEECDSLDIKVLARKKAKEYGIPVLMETSDRGMLDVERFDLEPDRPVLHGMIDHLDQGNLKELKTSEEKIPYLMPMVGLETMSHRLKASALEVGNSITTWPQLGTSVLLGGAILSDTYRRIILGDFKGSGRFIVDPAKIITEDVNSENNENSARPRGILSKKDMLGIVSEYSFESGDDISKKEIEALVEAASKAPSGGNAQPWKFLFKKGGLHLFLDRSSSESFMDFKYSASYMALGAALENIKIKSEALGYKTNVKSFPINENSDLIASLSFLKSESSQSDLEDQIDKRYTDRRMSGHEEIPAQSIDDLKAIASNFGDIEVDFIHDKTQIESLAEVVSEGDWLRIMNPVSHHDFISEEMRWNKDELEKMKDGIHVEELNLSPNDLAGLYLVKDEKVVSFMNENGYGKGLKHISKRLIASAPLLLTSFSKAWTNESFLNAGMLMERLWLYCTKNEIGFQVVNVPLAFLLRWKQGDMTDLSKEFHKEVDKMVDKMMTYRSDYKDLTDLFMVRLFVAKPIEPTSVRKGVEQILEFDNE